MSVENGQLEERLDCSPEFKEFLNQNKRAFMAAFMAIQGDIDSESGAHKVSYGKIATPLVESLGMDITRYDSSENNNRSIYRVEFGEQKFFVKRHKVGGDKFGDGFSEMKASKEVDQLLADIEGVRVVDYQLGYTRGDVSYFVSRWDQAIPGKSLEHYLGKLRISSRISKDSETREKAQAKWENLSDRIEELLGRLDANYLDVDIHNMAYDEATDTIIMFDLLNEGDCPDAAAFREANKKKFSREIYI